MSVEKRTSSMLEELHPSNRGQRILVVDDSSAVREALRDLLQSHSFDVNTAGNAEQALKVMFQSPPDLVLSDIMMPGGDGWQLQQEMRNSSEFCEVPFVFITAVGTEEQRRLALELGCDDYLRKPVDPLDLLSTIKGKLAAAEKRKKSALRRLQTQHRRVIHTLSHEFRTPLVSITTGAELLLDKRTGLNAGQVEKLLKTIYEGGRRLERLVNDFMLLQQIDLGQAAWQSQRGASRLKVTDIVANAVTSFRESLAEDGAPVQIDVQLDDPQNIGLTVNVYEVQVSNVIQRLLSNAYKFGGAKKPITVSIAASDSEVTIIVRDQGPGLPKPEDAGQLCELFLQIDRDINEQQGCGVGLTIARYLVELNGGRLEFSTPESGVGLEATVSFLLS